MSMMALFDDVVVEGAGTETYKVVSGLVRVEVRILVLVF
jgi:hypothetical protein